MYKMEDSNKSANMSMDNNTMFYDFEAGSPFRLWYIGTLFGILYVLVFLACICGNALVIFVIIKHRRMRNITNFFLANLAVSDFCVGVFCVIPNLMQFFDTYWYGGRVMCKLYFFIQCVSYTSSIIILTVISMERYFAIIHPMLSRRLSRMALMRVIIIIVWLTATAYGLPNLIAYDTIEMMEDDSDIVFCIDTGNMQLQIMVMLNFVLWYCIPLLLMSAMYTQISVVLWRSSFMMASQESSVRCRSREPSSNGIQGKSSGYKDAPLIPDKEHGGIGNNGSASSYKHNMVTKHDNVTTTTSTGTCDSEAHVSAGHKLKSSCSTKNALIARRKVIRLLISIVASFAICMLPHHTRLLHEMWIPLTVHPSFAHQLVPPLTSWAFYLNSALNPILYAFLSDNFRKSLREVFGCKRRGVSWAMKTGSTKTSKGASHTYLYK